MGEEFEMYGIIGNFDLCLGLEKKKVLLIQHVGLTKTQRLVKKIPRLEKIIFVE